MSGIHTLAPVIGVVAACAVMGVPRATFYRHAKDATAAPGAPRADTHGEAPGVPVAARSGTDATEDTSVAALALVGAQDASPAAACPPAQRGDESDRALAASMPAGERVLPELAAAPVPLTMPVEGPGVPGVARAQPQAPAAATGEPLALLEASGALAGPRAAAGRTAVPEHDATPAAVAGSADVTRVAVQPRTILPPTGPLHAVAVERPRKVVPRALPFQERAAVLALLNGERFCDLSPAEIYATLLDEGKYYCSERTMYRILAESDEVKERRDECRHPVYAKPELLATRPNEVWTWDITKLRGPYKGVYFHLYVIIDLYSRYVVGWYVSLSETAAEARRFIDETCSRHRHPDEQLTIHADRGSSMKSKEVAQLLADLGVIKSHSRPSVSDDNPYSEAHFKTLKYRPDFPERFGSIEDARAFCQRFFAWYNTEHHHVGIGLLTPHDVFHGDAKNTLAKRAAVLNTAYAAHPERFVRKPPQPQQLPEAVWINKPRSVSTIDTPIVKSNS